MEKARRYRIALFLLGSWYFLPRLVSGQEYEVIDLGATGTLNQPWGMSQSGSVVGWSELEDGHDEGFFYADGEVKLIGTPSGTSRTDLLGVNILDHATGKSGTVYENGQAILWTNDNSPDGHTESLGTLGGSRSAGKSINDFDQIVGWTKLEGDVESRPFLWQDGVMTALPLLGGAHGSADWINNAGQIVGSSTTDTDDLQQFAVFWDGGDPIRLPPQYPGLNNIANYIHDNGDIAGSAHLPDGEGGFITRAVVWRDLEVYLQLGTLADGSPEGEFASSWASGVNASGVVVGMSVNAESHLVPFVYRDGEMVQLSDLIDGEWTLVYVGAGGVNDAGQIAVSGFLPGEIGYRALLLNPTAPASAPSSPLTLRLEASPNPFGRNVTFRLPVPPGGAPRLDLVDASGRRVRTLRVPASGVVSWDGSDDRGREVSAGVYFARAPWLPRSVRVLRVR